MGPPRTLRWYGNSLLLHYARTPNPPSCSQPEHELHVEQLVSKLLPPPYQLDPLFGSYYSNASGLFHGDVRYYNLSSIPYDTNVTWRPIVDRVMENANLSTIPERLGSWNWGATDRAGFRVHDRMATVANVSEGIAIFQAACPLLHCAL